MAMFGESPARCLASAQVPEGGSLGKSGISPEDPAAPGNIGASVPGARNAAMVAGNLAPKDRRDGSGARSDQPETEDVFYSCARKSEERGILSASARTASNRGIPAAARLAYRCTFSALSRS